MMSKSEYSPQSRRRYPRKTKQQLANREAQRSGANAEYLVEQIGVKYESQMRARIRKRHEPYKRVGGVGRNGLFKAVNTGASGADFEVWLSDGRAGLMEVKSRKGKRVQLGTVGDTQACDLTKMTHWGHLALVLVRLGESWYLIDYRAWTHERKRSLNAEDLSFQGVPIDTDEFGSPLFIERIDEAIQRATDYLAQLERED